MNFHDMVDIYSKFLLRGRLSRAVTCARIHFGKVLNGVFRGKERLIYERSDIIAWRERYLRAIKKFRENNPDKDIVYTDETWLNQGHRTKKELVDVESLKNLSRRQPGYNDLTIGCTKPSTGKGGRLIIRDAMTDKGPVDGSLWIFKADQGKSQTKR